MPFCKRESWFSDKLKVCVAVFIGQMTDALFDKRPKYLEHAGHGAVFRRMRVIDFRITVATIFAVVLSGDGGAASAESNVSSIALADSLKQAQAEPPIRERVREMEELVSLYGRSGDLSKQQQVLIRKELNQIKARENTSRSSQGKFSEADTLRLQRRLNQIDLQISQHAFE